MRDIKKRAEEGRAIIRDHRRADLTLTEYDEIYRIVKEKGLFEGLSTAFSVGVSIGSRLS